MVHIIREYTNDDVESIKKCLIEIQEFERMLDPDRLKGIEIAHDYLLHLIQISKQEKGKIFVVEINGDIVGMISIVIGDNIHSTRNSRKIAYISDVIILPEYKDRGIMKELLAKAEEYAKSKRVYSIQTEMLSNHADGIDGFQRNGFHTFKIILKKNIL